jgi:tRNA-specific 2-thiouridylase
LRIRSRRVVEARFLAFGCPAMTAAADAACGRLRGASLEDAMALSADTLDRELGGLGPAGRHGPQIVIDALARALETWFSDRLGTPGIPLARNRVAVAMSGGVDSAVAAHLLATAGHEVIGVTMRLWHDPAAAAAERSCCAPETVRLARESAHRIGIPHLTLDVAERFRRDVVEGFVAAHRAGLTPNPCVTCNGTVRFTVLADAAALLGARGLATGHYAAVAPDARGQMAVARAADRDKDQGYMLAFLDTAVLRRVIFPLGAWRKDDVRALAAGLDLPAALAVESQEVCFVGEGGHVPFLERAGLSPREGVIRHADGRELGRHSGYWRFTVGQRRGVGGAAAGPLYVLGTDAARNEVVVGPREALATSSLVLRDVLLHGDPGGELEVRVRYRGRSLRGSVRSGGDGLAVTLDDPADGAAPGQVATLTRDGRIVGAGIIAGTTSAADTRGT